MALIHIKIPSLSSAGAVGKTILEQIRQLDKSALMAWGAKDYVTFDNGIVMGKITEGGAGVIFTVKCPEHRGRVAIRLNERDYYDIYLFAIRKLEIKVKRIVRDIDVGSLVTTLDELLG